MEHQHNEDISTRKIAPIKVDNDNEGKTQNMAQIYVRLPQIFTIISPKLLFAIVKATSLACRAHMQSVSSRLIILESISAKA